LRPTTVLVAVSEDAALPAPPKLNTQTKTHSKPVKWSVKKLRIFEVET